MDLNTKLIIKVQLNDEIRKMPIHNEDMTYDELIIMMERVFKHKLNPDDEIIIKYKDEDSDLITISDDSDLAFAIENSKILKLNLTIENQKSKAEEEKLADEEHNSFSSEEIIAIRKELKFIRDTSTRLLDKLNDGGVVDNDHQITDTTGTMTMSRTIDGQRDSQLAGGKEFDPLSTDTQSINSLVSGNMGHVTMSNCNGSPNYVPEQSNPIVNTPMKQNPIGISNNFLGHPLSQMTSNASSSMQQYQQNVSPSVTASNMGVNQNLVPNFIGSINTPRSVIGAPHGNIVPPSNMMGGMVAGSQTSSMSPMPSTISSPNTFQNVPPHHYYQQADVQINQNSQSMMQANQHSAFMINSNNTNSNSMPPPPSMVPQTGSIPQQMATGPTQQKPFYHHPTTNMMQPPPPRALLPPSTGGFQAANGGPNAAVPPMGPVTALSTPSSYFNPQHNNVHGSPFTPVVNNLSNQNTVSAHYASINSSLPK